MTKYCIIIMLTLFVSHTTLARTLEGYVLDASSGGAIVAASVTDSGRHGTFTDENGHFTIAIGTNITSLSISSVGYLARRVVVNTNEHVMTIYLTPDVKQISEVTVVGDKNDRLMSSHMGVVALDEAAIRRVPVMFGEADVVKALQLQPGVSAGIEGFAGLNVHGGDDDQNLFIIDGHPLYQMGHLGGLFSAFNVDAVSTAQFYKATFPARYGGRVSSVLDMRTKECRFDKYHGSAMLGLTSGSVSVTGPIFKNKTAFTFAMRRSWLDLMARPALSIYNHRNKDSGKKTIADYAFMDINGKISHKTSENSTLNAMVYYATDHLKMGEGEFSPANASYRYQSEDLNKLHWGNLVISLGWTKKMSHKVNLAIDVAHTHYSSWMRHSVEESQGRKGDADYQHDMSMKTTSNSIVDNSAKVDVTWRAHDKHQVRAGAAYTYHHFKPNHQLMHTSDDVIAADSLGTRANVFAHEGGVYVEDEMALGSNVEANVGVRCNLFKMHDKSHFTFEPRLALRMSVSNTLSIKGGYTRMAQFVQQVNDSYISLPTDFWLPIEGHFKPLTSDQLSVGAYYAPRKDYAFSLEGYYKWMHHLLEYKDGYRLMPATVAWHEKLTDGNGTAYGIDMLAEKREGRWRGHVSYSLLWTHRRFAEIDNGKSFPSKYDNRHKLNVLCTFACSKRVEINAAWTFMSGNRMTVALENYQGPSDAGFSSGMFPNNPLRDEIGLDYYQGRNNVRLPAYHRLDVGISFYRPKSKGRMGIWNISVYNAYSRMNPISVEKNSDVQKMDGTRLRPRFRSLALLPIIPSVSYTYKF